MKNKEELENRDNRQNSERKGPWVIPREQI